MKIDKNNTTFAIELYDDIDLNEMHEWINVQRENGKERICIDIEYDGYGGETYVSTIEFKAREKDTGEKISNLIK